MRAYSSFWSHLFFFFSILTCRTERDANPTVTKGKSDNSEEPSFIQSSSETEMKETAEYQKRRSAHPRACTQNVSTNDNMGYLKGQENPDIHLLSLHIMKHMTQLRGRKYLELSERQKEAGYHQTIQAPPEERF